jgi:hypothetical protein
MPLSWGAPRTDPFHAATRISPFAPRPLVCAASRAGTASGAGPGPGLGLAARAHEREAVRESGAVGSPQTLSEADRRAVAAWAGGLRGAGTRTVRGERPGGQPPPRCHRPNARLCPWRTWRCRGDPPPFRRRCRGARGERRGSGGRRPSGWPGGEHCSYGRARARCGRLRRQGGWACRPRPPGGCRGGDSLAIRTYVTGDESRPATAATRRREFLRSARTGAPRVGPSRHDHPPAPGRSDGARRGPSLPDERRCVWTRFVLGAGTPLATNPASFARKPSWRLSSC